MRRVLPLLILGTLLLSVGCASPGGDTVPPEDLVTVTGTLTDEGVECPAVRGDDGTLYTLTGADLGQLEPGDRVRVTGTPVEVSICMQGTTLDVRELRATEGGA